MNTWIINNHLISHLASDVEFNVSVGDVNANDDAGTVSKIEPGTTVDTLRSKFTVQGGSVKITDASGKEKTHAGAWVGVKNRWSNRRALRWAAGNGAG